MYATISSVQLKPHTLTAFRERWSTVIEPQINQLPALVDLYVFLNQEAHTLLVCHIYASAAAAQAAGALGADQPWVEQCADLLHQETIAHTGYTIIST